MTLFTYLLTCQILFESCRATNNVISLKSGIHKFLNYFAKWIFILLSYNVRLYYNINWMSVRAVTELILFYNILYVRNTFLWFLSSFVWCYLFLCSQSEREKSSLLRGQKYITTGRRSLPYMSAAPIHTGEIDFIIYSLQWLWIIAAYCVQYKQK